jgi:PAS domain S-box-containing protein
MRKTGSPNDASPAGYYAPEEDLPRDSVFHAVFESSRAIMFLLDPATGTVVGANPAACEFYGYAPADIPGVSLRAISLLPENRINELLHYLNSERGVRFATRHRLRSGQLRDMELDAAPVVLRSKRRCLLFIGHDISDRMQAERSLRRSESLMRAILNSAGDGIAFRDTQGIYREANPAFCRQVDAPCEEVLGRGARDFFDRRAASRHVQMDRRAITGSVPVSYELVQNGPRGECVLSVNKTQVVDAAGELLGVVSISRDITRQRQAEASLRKSEGLLRAMFQSAQDCIFITDENDILRELNQTFCARMGLPRAQLIDKHISQVFQGELLRVQASTNSLARTTREPVSFTQRMFGEGRDVWISVVKTAVVDSKGDCLGVLNMGRDITSQRTAELALRQSERRLAGLIRQAPVGVFETDTAGRLLFANERMQRHTDRDQEALAGEGWLASIHPDDQEDFLAAWGDAIANKRDLDREVRLCTGAGAGVWMICRVRPMTDAANRFCGFLGVFSDISERKKAEALRSDVESVVRHDLKSPLSSVQNAMELLDLLGPLNAEQQKVLDEVRTLARRMQGLISLSLDLHAMEAGAFTPQVEALDVRAEVAGLAAELRPLTEGKQLAIELTGAEADAPFLVLGEQRLLNAILTNLLKNAAEAAPDGDHIQVRLQQQERVALVTVRNRGEVPADVRERFFEKYATSGKIHGTGLGTYSARLMAKVLGGGVSLDVSEPGHTSVTLRLPAASGSSGTATAV